MEQRCGVWGLLGGSVGSAETYRDAAAGRMGRMMGYLALLIGLVTVCITVWAQVGLVVGLRDLKPWLKANVPEIHIHGGVASSPVTQPYVWVTDHRFAFILDTTGATTELDPTYPQGILLTKTELIYRRSEVESRRYALSRMPDFVLNGATIDRWMTAAQRWLWIAIVLGVWCWLWVAKLVRVAFWSLLGLLVNALAGRRLRYGAIVNVGILALTIPTAFDTVMLLAGMHAPRRGLISLALYLGYLVWGILVQPVAPEPAPTAT